MPVVKRPFTKAATTYADQVALLRKRGMTIDDLAEAEFFLQHLNYYRLGAYWLPFEADHSTHTFKRGTHFSDVLAMYVFDRELRLVVLNAMERVEVSVRSQWAYQMAHRHGPHAHLDPALSRKVEWWKKNVHQLTDEVERSNETFISHLRENYAESLPPVWAVCEVMSLGTLSRWYGNLRPMATRRAIAKVYEVDEGVLASWLQHLTLVRNVCAHHSRLWNREFTITPEIPRSKPEYLVSQFERGSRKIHNALVILLHLMDLIAPGHHWRRRLRALLARPEVQLAVMGFPTQWESRAIWSGMTR